MDFKDYLNEYIDEIDCTSKDIVAHCTISASAISRYRSGERVPSQKSDAIVELSQALADIAASKNMDHLSYEDIYETLCSSFIKPDYNNISAKLNLIINGFNINIAQLAKNLNYDVSYVSKIKNNKRQPANIHSFISKFCRYVTARLYSEEDYKRLGSIIDIKDLNSSNCYHNLQQWFFQQEIVEASDSSSFLTKLDNFDLDNFIEAIHFNDIKVPTVPFQLTTHRTYAGIEQMRQGELDFIKSTVLSKSTQPLIMCSDMPMEEMAKDLDFSKKWMFGLAVVLKKGLTIQIIHNLDRPFTELMLGLESWIPLYMTGLVKPYYFAEKNNNVYRHLHYSSGEVALLGEGIQGASNTSFYYLTRKKEEVAKLREYSAALLNSAKPLMDIYTSEDYEKYRCFLDSYTPCSNVTHKYTSLPLYTMERDQLSGILEKNHLHKAEIKRLLDYYEATKKHILETLKDYEITDELPYITKENFSEHKPYLLLSDGFCSKMIYYDYEDYTTHLEATKALEQGCENYHIFFNDTPIFKNIQISIIHGQYVTISKCMCPNIHFVIYHPTLCHAIEHMEIAVTE